MKAVGMLGLALLLAAAATGAVPQTAGQLKVTVDYRGAGTVDGTHEVFVWLFDTPDITVDSVPLAQEVVTKNGTTLSFSGLPKEVYMAAAFDETGEYDGTAGPPPPGSPVRIYGESGVAAAILTGAEAAITMTFDDSTRMP